MCYPLGEDEGMMDGLLFPLWVGALMGAAIVGSLYWSRALHERSGVAVLVACIAFFWPVFAVQAEAGVMTIVGHAAGFLLFSGLAVWGFRTGMMTLAVLLASHGVFDACVALAHHPGPPWWPAFCGALDVVAGVGIFTLVQVERVPT
ncbi:MAG: hypothetical protein AAGA56_09050 [Myxococcota bacterium]